MSGPTVVTTVLIVMIIVVVLVAMAYLTYAERKGHGPPCSCARAPMVVGPFGLLQPFADGLKLLGKETIIPAGANRVVFIIAPMITFLLSLVAWAVIPVSTSTWVLARHQCGRAVPVRDLVAGRLRHHHGRLGLEFEIRLPGRPALRGRRWCPTRVSIGFVIITVLALRRFAEPVGDRHGPAHRLVGRRDTGWIGG